MSDIDAVKWLHSASGRSKRTSITKVGCFVLEHVATGRFWIDTSKEVSKEVDAQLKLISAEKHPCKLLNGLCSKDGDVRVYEYPVKSDAKCAALVKQLKDAATNDYLCLNQEPKRNKRKK
jgi:hypothetical protein